MAGISSKPVLPNGFNAAADLSAEAKLGLCMKRDTSGNIVVCDTAGERSCGILAAGSRSVAGGDALYGPVTIESKGITPGRLGGTVARRDYLTPNASGALVKVNAPGQMVRAVAMEAGVSGDLVDVELVEFILAPVSWDVHCDLTLLDNEVVARMRPGFAGFIYSNNATVTKPTTDASGKKVVLTPGIGAADAVSPTVTTGGVATIDTDVTAADPDAQGKYIAGTAITAANTFTSAQEISLNASDFTVFTDGHVAARVIIVPTGN